MATSHYFIKHIKNNDEIIYEVVDDDKRLEGYQFRYANNKDDTDKYIVGDIDIINDQYKVSLTDFTSAEPNSGYSNGIPACVIDGLQDDTFVRFTDFPVGQDYCRTYNKKSCFKNGNVLENDTCEIDTTPYRQGLTVQTSESGKKTDIINTCKELSQNGRFTVLEYFKNITLDGKFTHQCTVYGP